MIREAQHLMQGDFQEKHTSVKDTTAATPLMKPEYLDKLVRFEKTKQDEGV